MEYMENLCYKIIGYVNRCFKDAFISEGRSYDGSLYNFIFIIVRKVNTGKKILFPVVFWCKYDRIKRRVYNRLKNNLMKKYGLHFIRSNNISIMSYEHQPQFSPRNSKGVDNGIDPNHVITNIEVDIVNSDIRCKKYFWICAVNRNYEEDVDFNLPIPAKKLYQLTLTHFNYTADQLQKLVDTNEKYRQEHFGTWSREYQDKVLLPDTLNHDWTAFKQLHNKAFGYDPDDGFEITFGPCAKICDE